MIDFSCLFVRKKRDWFIVRLCFIWFVNVFLKREGELSVEEEEQMFLKSNIFPKVH